MKMVTITSLAIALSVSAMSAPAQQKMGNMNMDAKPAVSAQQHHSATGTVKKVDTKAGKVILAHEPIASMNWPAMTMGFKVKDSMLLEKLSVGRKVEFQFSQEGKEYVISGVKQ